MEKGGFFPNGLNGVFGKMSRAETDAALSQLATKLAMGAGGDMAMGPMSDMAMGMAPMGDMMSGAPAMCPPCPGCGAGGSGGGVGVGAMAPAGSYGSM
jgi:hypothetical protein